MIKLIQIGLGPIGQQLTRYLSEREGIKIVGGVDLDPTIIGKDVGQIAGLKPLGIPVSPNLETAMANTEAQVALITTVSSLKKMEPQIIEAANFDLNVVSTCEELICPFHEQPIVAERIHKYCKERQISCIGTGVNPGFLMDYLPAVLSSVCQYTEHVVVERYQDASPRRKSFHKKIGAGLTVEEFKNRESTIRHVGLKESVQLIARAFGWTLQRVEETIEAVPSEKIIENEELKINKGDVAGVRQMAIGYMDDMEVIKLDFKAAAGLDNAHDSISITGTPSFTSVIENGINGDIATSAIIVNVIRSIVRTDAGLKTMLDIPTPSYFRSL